MSSSSSLDCLELCRLCLEKERVSVPIFENEGDVRQIFLKITACLPVKVSRDDKLPKKICDDCLYKVELFYQFWNTTANAEKQLLQWLGEVGGLEDGVPEVLVSNVMKQEQASDNRLEGRVVQVGGQNSVDMGMIENMTIITMPVDGEQQFASVPMDTSGTVTVQAVASSSASANDQSQTSVSHLADEVEDDDDDDDDDGCDNEGMPVKEENEEDQSDRVLDQSSFVTIPCDEAGPSGLQQKIADISNMSLQPTEVNDPKTGSSLSNGIQDHRLSINQVNQTRHQPAILKRKAIDDANSPVVVKVDTDESGEWEAVDETAQNFNETTEVFICKSCNAVFTEKRQLDIHRTNNHPRLIIVPKEVANTDESDIVYYGDYHQVLSTGKFHCGHCPSILSSIGAVRKHFRRLHKGVTVYTANVSKLTAKLTTSKKIETEEVPEAKNEKEVIIVRNFLKDPSDNLLRPCPCCDFSTLKCNVFRNHVRINHPDVWLKLSGLRIIKHPNNEVTPNNPPEDDHNDGEDDTMGYWEQYEEETNQRLADKESTTTTVGNAPIHKKEAKQFSCPHCSYVSYGRSGMATHMNRFHTSENKKKNVELSQEPMIIPTWTGYACGYCSFVGCNISSVNRHSDRKHSSLDIMMGEIPVTTFDCDACKFRCEGRVPMYNHQKIHLPEPNEQGTYTCIYCKFTLSTIDNVLRHISRKHMALQESSMEELVECDRCEFSSMNKRVMEWHKEQHDLPPEKAGQTYACDECNYFSYEKRQLNYHLKRKHRIAIVSDTTTKNVKKVVEPKPMKDSKTVVPKAKRKKIAPPPPIKNFKCEFCSWATTSQVLLDFHIVRKHKPKKEYTCDHCGKAFSLKGDLKLHIRNKHMTQVNYICDVCGQLCKTRNGLHVHQLYAHLESEFKCHICNKFMVSEGKLQDHIVYHHEKAPYVCEICGRTYREAYKMKDHMRTHTGERPHACPVCNKSFAKRCGLRQHILTHSNERPYICDVCERPFSQKTGVITHRKKFHPEVVDPLPPMPREIVDRVISDVVDGKNTVGMVYEE